MPLLNVLRPPTATSPGRMAPLARLPVFLALEGRRAAIGGGSAAAAWKAELLSAAGASVDVYAADISEEMKTIAEFESRAGSDARAVSMAPRRFTSITVSQASGVVSSKPAGPGMPTL